MAGFRSGLFWGAVFGGIAGLMNAPKSGKETREDVKLFIESTTEDVNDVRYKVDNLKIAIHRLSNEGLSSAKIASEEIQESLKHFEEENQPRIRRIQESLNDLESNMNENTLS